MSAQDIMRSRILKDFSDSEIRQQLVSVERLWYYLNLLDQISGGGGLSNVDVIPVTFSQFQNLVATSTLLSGRTYEVSGVHNTLCTVYLLATSVSTYSGNGWCSYTNIGYSNPVEAACEYDLTQDNLDY